MGNNEKILTELFTQKGEEALLDLKYIPNVDVDFLIHLMHRLNIPFPFKILENTWLKRYDNPNISHGWGNGYVKLIEGHQWYGMEYENIPVSIHGGLTFGQHVDSTNNKGFDNGFWIGFDTSHYSDTLEKWPEYEVWDETVKLFAQCYLS